MAADAAKKRRGAQSAAAACRCAASDGASTWQDLAAAMDLDEAACGAFAAMLTEAELDAMRDKVPTNVLKQRCCTCVLCVYVCVRVRGRGDHKCFLP